MGPWGAPAATDGPRVQRRRQRRLRRRRRLLLAFGVAVVAGALGAAGLVQRGRQPAVASSSPGAVAPTQRPTEPALPATEGRPAADRQHIVLLVQAEPGGEAQAVTLLVAGPAQEGLVLLVPPAVSVEVPGLGLERLDRVQQLGGAPLAASGLQQALEVAVGGGGRIAAEGVAALLGRPDAPDDLAEQAEAWRARLASVAEAAGARSRRDPWAAGLAAVAPASAVAPTRQVLDGLALAARAGRLRVERLPRVDAGEAQDGRPLLLVDPEAVEGLVSGPLAPSAAALAGRARVQLLNGVGAPGLVAAADRRLGGAFRTVAWGNARRFGERRTEIVVYDRSSLAAARRVRELLGVGTILISRQPQSVVDLTVVLGTDFRPGGAGPPSVREQDT